MPYRIQLNMPITPTYPASPPIIQIHQVFLSLTTPCFLRSVGRRTWHALTFDLTAPSRRCSTSSNHAINYAHTMELFDGNDVGCTAESSSTGMNYEIFPHGFETIESPSGTLQSHRGCPQIAPCVTALSSASLAHSNVLLASPLYADMVEIPNPKPPRLKANLVNSACLTKRRRTPFRLLAI